MEEILEITKDVSNSLGKGYSEKIYQEAICSMLRVKSINYSKEAIHSVFHKEFFVGHVRSDIILHDHKTVVECKAIDGELKIHHVSQIIIYMKLTGYNTGILVNFIQNSNKKLFDYIKVYREDDIFTAKNSNICEKLDINACII